MKKFPPQTEVILLTCTFHFSETPSNYSQIQAIYHEAEKRLSTLSHTLNQNLAGRPSSKDKFTYFFSFWMLAADELSTRNDEHEQNNIRSMIEI